MRITKNLRSFYWSVIFFSVIIPSVVGAAAMDDVTGGLSVTAGVAGFGTTATPITSVVGNAINAVLGLIGIVFLCFLVYAGALYFISQGEKEPVEKAKKILKTTITGIIIIIAAYAISTYVMRALAGVV